MKFCLIVAMTTGKRVIGRDNKLPWHLPEDLKHFKALTMGHPIIMGRKTWDSIGRPLPGRTSIVVTRDRKLQIPGATVVHSLEEALAPYRNTKDQVFMIGGSSLFEESLPIADRIYVTWIDEEIEGDVYFPEFDVSKFKVVEEFLGGGEIRHRYLTYERRT